MVYINIKKLLIIISVITTVLILSAAAKNTDSVSTNHAVLEARKANTVKATEIKRKATGNVRKPTSVPILMYHSINDNPVGEPDLSVKSADFDQQMKYLTDNGFTPIGFNDLASYGRYKKPIIITFDDGYEDNYKNAYPILKKYNIKATVFVVSSYINQPGYLTEKEMHDMADIISFQSHTVSHKPLSTLSAKQIETEMSVSKDRIFQITNKPVNVIAYPNGDFNASVLKTAAKYYSYAVTTKFGYYNSASPKFKICRVAVSRFENLKRFAFFVNRKK